MMKPFSLLLALLMAVSLFAAAVPVSASAEELPEEAIPLKPPTMWTIQYTKRAFPDDPREVPFDAGEYSDKGPIIYDGEAAALWYFNTGSTNCVPILNYNRAVSVNEVVLAEVHPPEWEFLGLAHSVYTPFTAYEKLSVWYADGFGAEMEWKEAKIKGCYTDTSEGFEVGLDESVDFSVYEHIGNIHIVFDEVVTAECFMIFCKDLGNFELCVSPSSYFTYCVYGPGYLPVTEAPETEPPATETSTAETPDSADENDMGWLYIVIAAVAVVVVAVVIVAVKKKKK